MALDSGTGGWDKGDRPDKPERELPSDVFGAMKRHFDGNDAINSRIARHIADVLEQSRLDNEDTTPEPEESTPDQTDRAEATDTADDRADTPQESDSHEADPNADTDRRDPRSPEESDNSDPLEDNIEQTDSTETAEQTTGLDRQDGQAQDVDPAPTDDRHHATDSVGRWDIRERPKDADLIRLARPDIAMSDVEGYIDAQRPYLPWLPAFDHATDESRRVLVAFAIGDGHTVERHSNYVDIDMATDRVTRLHDPANTDLASQFAANDAYKIDRETGEPAMHRCGADATFVNDPDAFATALVNAGELPDVRAILDRTIGPSDRARGTRLEIPIADLLGPDGHRYCDGVQLVPPDRQTIDQARIARNQWVGDQRAGQPSSVPAPVAKPIGSFENGTFLIAFSPKSDRSGYTITTMFPQPEK